MTIQPIPSLAVLVCGLQGVEAKLRLPAAAEADPADDDSAERLPQSLKEAIHSFEGDPGDQP